MKIKLENLISFQVYNYTMHPTIFIHIIDVCVQT